MRFGVIKGKLLLFCLAVPLAAGGISGFLIRDSTAAYAEMERPPFSPPGVVFPIVWTVLYLLMGVSCYIAARVPRRPKRAVFALYALQLAVNFLWPLVFFCQKELLLAFVLLVLLWGLVLLMIFAFSALDRKAALLQIPYLLWLTFAGYLNWGIYLLNPA